MSSYMDRMVSPGAWDLGIVLVWVLGVALVVVMGVLAYRFLAPRTRPDPGTAAYGGSSQGASALGSLEFRYATGQIDEEEFKQQRGTILTGRGRSV